MKKNHQTISFNEVNFREKGIATHNNGAFLELLGAFSSKVNNFKFEQGKKVSINENIITLPDNPSFENIIELNKQLGVSDVSKIGERLQDVAILLAREKKVPEGLYSFIVYLYRLGKIIDQQDLTYSQEPLTIEDLRNQSLHIPDQVNETVYEKELWMYMIGKYDRQMEFPDVDKDNAERRKIRNYHDLYSRWRERKIKTEGLSLPLDPDKENSLREEFDKIIWEKKELIKSLVLASILRENQISSKTQEALEALVESALTQTALAGVVEHGMEKVREKMRLPPYDRLTPYLKAQLDSDLFWDLKKLYPNLEEDVVNLYQAVEHVLIEHDSDSDLKKAQIIWDILQAYEFSLIFESFEYFIDNRKFGGLTRSMIAVDLFKRYLSHIKVAAISLEQHVFLGIKIGEELYMFDAARTKERRYDKSSSLGINDDTWLEIKPILSKYFSTGMPQVYSSRNIKTGYVSIDDPKRNLQAGLLTKIASSVGSDKEKNIALLKLALIINPNCKDAWFNLGFYSTNDDEKNYYFKKALEINPTDEDVLNILIKRMPEVSAQEIKEKLNFYERSATSLLNLPTKKPQDPISSILYKYTQNFIKFLQKEIERLKELLNTSEVDSYLHPENGKIK